MSDYKKIDQVLDLVAKTGDRVIVVSDKHDPYVIMSTSEYESLLHSSSELNNLTEEQLLDKINRDISVWRSSQEDLSEYNLDQFKADTEKKEEKPEEKVEVEEDKYYIEPVD